MTLKITLKELEALKPCHVRYGAMLAKTFPRKRKFSIADAFAADISQADILWTLYALKSDDVNSKINSWLASLIKRAADYAAKYADDTNYAADYADYAAEAALAAERAELAAFYAADAVFYAAFYAADAAADYADAAADYAAACAADYAALAAERATQKSELIELFS